MKLREKLTPRNILLFVLWSIFIASALVLLKLFVLDPFLNSQINNNVQEIYHGGDDEHTKKFNELREVNPDIVGWIYMPKVVIDYPVLKSSDTDPEYYLYRDYTKQETRYGSIFMDSICSHNIDSKSMIIHGHSMRDGSMFGGILKFSDIDVYKTSPVITFDTVYKKSKWKIFSIFKTNIEKSQGDVFEYLVADFGSNESFLEYMYQVRKRSIIETPVDINDDDRIIILSTCSYEFENFRTVIVAREVRTSENPDVDVSLAKYAVNPYMPACWYRKNGGKQPVLTSFSEELANGTIDWYK